MATAKIHCSICNEQEDTYECKGCSQIFCFQHLTEHREIINKQFNVVEDTCNIFRQNLIDRKKNLDKNLLTEQINQWEKESIRKIQQAAYEYKQRLTKYINEYIIEIEDKLNDLSEQIKQIRKRNKFNEIDLNQLNDKLIKLKTNLDIPPIISIQETETPLINKISIRKSLDRVIKWKQTALTIAGGNGQGWQSNQLHKPVSLAFDNKQTLYIADTWNHRIVQLEPNSTNTRVLLRENSFIQFSGPPNIIIDKKNDSLIIADKGNKRVIRCYQRNLDAEIIVSNIDCWGLAMDKDGSIYVADWDKHEVRQWKQGEKTGTLVAGGNGKGDELNQLNNPTFILVDDDYSLYISDQDNHRVMKWIQNAKEGIIVAGGNGIGKSLSQLSSPAGIIVDQFDQIYVVDCGNHRVMHWPQGAKEGSIIFGGNGEGDQSNQLNFPRGLSFDRHGNLYVADWGNNRIQKFEIV